jgi:uncharacterized protein YegP (UPF0339 family)
MDRVNTRIRIRSTLSRQWIWELVTRDGHVANASEIFATREECESDAKQQGLPVSGLRRSARPKAAPASNRQAAQPWTIHKDTVGLWRWERRDERSEVIAGSTCAYLTRGECLADAQKHGYPAEQGTTNES